MEAVHHSTDSRRLAMFVHTLDERAVSRLILKLCREFAAAGHEVVLICATRGPDAPTTMPAGVAVDDLDVGHRRTGFAVARLARRLRALAPDVVFAHLNGPGRAAVLARALARVPTRVVIVEHTHYSTFGWSHRRLRDLLTGLLYPMADAVAGVSPAVTADLEAHFPRLLGKTHVLPSVGPDPGDVAALAGEVPDHPWFRSPDRHSVICSIANLVPRKGQRTLVEALRILSDTLSDARLVLVGRADHEDFVRDIEGLAERLGVRESLWLAGYKRNPLPFVRHAAAFVHASHTDGCPMVIVEAMACGVPVVAADSPGGSSFILNGGSCGVLVPVGDARATAAALARVLTDRPLRDTIVARGLERAEDFTPRRVAAAYLDLVERYQWPGGIRQ